MTETRPSYLYAAVQAVENDEEQALARADLDALRAEAARLSIEIARLKAMLNRWQGIMSRNIAAAANQIASEMQAELEQNRTQD